MTTPTDHSGAPHSRGRLAVLTVWLPGLAVALGAAVATMHGLYEVALASRVPASIAWLYPLITDGLALVAYTATARLAGRAARYAWTVVVIAAGLSGIAQAVYLAADPPPVPASPQEAAPALVTSAVLRFGVGAWPAIAAAVCAHLLFLLIASSRPSEHASDGAGVRPSSHPGPVPERPTTPAAAAHAERSALPSVVRTSTPSAAEVTRPIPAVRSGGGGAAEPRARDRARAAAERHRAGSDDWPTVSQLMELAQVSRGTAGDALKPYGNSPHPCTWSTTSTPTRPNHEQPAQLSIQLDHNNDHDTQLLHSAQRHPEQHLNSDKIKGLTPWHHDPRVGAGLRPAATGAPRG